jgi:hypothetical protein
MRFHLVLHPGLKLEYFHRQKWEDDWIEAAENLTREEYVDAYENRIVGDEESSDKINVSCRLDS